MSIKFYRKNVYGQERLYLADDFYAGYAHILTNKETVNESDLHALSQISGQKVEEVLNPARAPVPTFSI